ncbi:MAG: hypothetical protein GXO09_03825 [Crenarchaeota archaeon]|nr:hypothetical protein [Thermoproteota archaeon]
MLRVELFPPGWMGRSLQLLAIAVGGPEHLDRLSPDAALFPDKEAFIDLLLEAYSIAESIALAKARKPQPRLYGNDTKPLKKLLGVKVTRWGDAARLLVERLEKGELDPGGPRVVAVMLTKLNIFEHLRAEAGAVKASGPASQTTPAGLALAMVGGLLAKMGAVGTTGVYLLPGPDTPLEALDDIAPLYAVLALEPGEDTTPPLPYIFTPRTNNAPVSLDVLLTIYGASILADQFSEEEERLCGETRLNALHMASISEAGNRPILAQLAPLSFSEPLCLLGTKALKTAGRLIHQALTRGICRGGGLRGAADPGSEAVLACTGKLYLYSMTGNNTFLYDCARLIHQASTTKECSGAKNLTWLLRSLRSTPPGREVQVT